MRWNRGGSNNPCFIVDLYAKYNVYPGEPVFYYLKVHVGCECVKITRYVNLMFSENFRRRCRGQTCGSQRTWGFEQGVPYYRNYERR